MEERRKAAAAAEEEHEASVRTEPRARDAAKKVLEDEHRKRAQAVKDMKAEKMAMKKVCALSRLSLRVAVLLLPLLLALLLLLLSFM